MKEITVKVPEEQFDFFNELIDQLGFVRVKRSSRGNSSAKNKILSGIEKGVKEVKLAKEGKLKARKARLLLNEI